jgi:hypothetical protein
LNNSIINIINGILFYHTFYFYWFWNYGAKHF